MGKKKRKNDERQHLKSMRHSENVALLMLVVTLAVYIFFELFVWF